jgi:hypothetical protein
LERQLAAEEATPSTPTPPPTPAPVPTTYWEAVDTAVIKTVDAVTQINFPKLYREYDLGIVHIELTLSGTRLLFEGTRGEAGPDQHIFSSYFGPEGLLVSDQRGHQRAVTTGDFTGNTHVPSWNDFNHDHFIVDTRKICLSAEQLLNNFFDKSVFKLDANGKITLK